MLQLSTVLLLIAMATVHATSIAQKKREVNNAGTRQLILPYPTLECWMEPLTLKQRCQQQAAGVPLTRLGTGLYSFQTSQKLNWYQARDWCRARGMDLVTVETAAEDQLITNYLYNYYITNAIPKDSTSFFWTGLNDLGTDRAFTWVATGQPLGTYTNWSPGQPAGTNEHCGEYMYRDAPKPAWNDRGCTDWTGPFICEVSAPCKCYVGV